MQIKSDGDNKEWGVANLLLSYKPILIKAWLFGLIANTLSLAPALYMLEVYDRVINSRSLVTLLMLTIVVICVYFVMEFLEWVRAELLKKVAINIEQKKLARVFNAIFFANLQKINVGGIQPLTDLRTLKEFLYSPSLMAILETPVLILYLLLIFLISPVLGWLAIFGGLVQLIITWITEKRTQPALSEANKAAIAAQQYANGSLRNGQVIESMGMIQGIESKWMEHQLKFLNNQAIASDYASTLTVSSKLLQQIVSSAVLGIGCWLYLQGNLAGGGGMMIVASILAGKVLQPLVTILSNWKQIVNARDAYHRLFELLAKIPEPEPAMPLPPPKGKLQVENVIVAAPGSNSPILKNVSFALDPGECLAVVGPSASGKTSLARLLMGLWPAQSGKVRLDGVDIYLWNKDELGSHVGYLPQNVELFEGTLGDNIARFGSVDEHALDDAAKMTGIDELVKDLPAGHRQLIGSEGAILSGGQRQRVGLARAIYGLPKYVVLDEPNASLDEAGDRALLVTLQRLKEAGTTVVIITHRPQILQIVDKMLVLIDGSVKLFGKRDDVLEALNKARQPSSPTSAL
jgi:ATP-binding cassette subfamily C exporter for protease/lipase